ncbi:unnamed protein product, partial [Rotaria sp. Silwood1]
RETNLRTLGKILWDTEKFDLAEKYLTEFLNQLPSNDPSLSSIYDDLSKVALQAGDYEKSVRWSKKAFEFRNSNALLHTLNINVSDDAICKFINIKDII